MPDLTIYRTADEATVAQYRANLTAREEITARLAEFRTAQHIPEASHEFGTRMFDGRFVIRGFTWDEKDPAPVGWRIPMGYGIPVIPVTIQPDKRMREGKRIAEALRKLTLPSVKANLGMPDSCLDLSAMTRHWFGLRFDEAAETLWVRFRADTDVDQDFAAHVAPVWERVKLSEYFAMVEAGNDPFAEKESVDA